MSKAKTEADPNEGVLTLFSGGQNDAGLTQLPAFMEEDVGMGLSETKKFVKPGRAKVMQDNRTDAYEAFDPGSVVITPTNLVLAKLNEPFYVVPLFFFPEWCTVNPLEMKGQLPMIRARTLDVTSDIARKSRDPDARKKDRCPENQQYVLSHNEYLNYICWVARKPELSGTPVLFSFSRGEHKVGSNWANLLELRRGSKGKFPIFANVFECRVPTLKRKNVKGQWYGIDVTNPSAPNCPAPFVQDPVEYAKLKEAHLSLVEAHQASLIDIDYEEDEADRPEAGPSPADDNKAPY